jgi:DNA (cytosine-5)-methyltransferase 1
MKFIDLFAGLGGFHLALSRLGHQCVFACEKEHHLRELYEKNFGILPTLDIREVDIESIPQHEILCAGFPCQPFSKAGDQQGFACPKNGDLFDYVVRIVERHRPKYLLLENVPNLKWHNNGDTLGKLERKLEGLGYNLRHERLSPHHFGIPQIRERIFIVGSRSGLATFGWPERVRSRRTIRSVLSSRPKTARRLSAQVQDCLDTWQRFIVSMPSNVEFPACPIWSMEFGATYPYEETTPHRMGARALSAYRGSHGVALREASAEQVMDLLPSHARTKQDSFPAWKVRFIKQNREFYQANRDWIKPWLPSILRFPPSLQKLEWNCKGEERDIWRYVIQFRASGVRVKRPTTAPSLIAMTTTQVPIIGWEQRYMTPRECAKLQSMAELKYLPKSDEKAFAALGNAVNADVVELVASALFDSENTDARQDSGRDSRERKPRKSHSARQLRVA